MLQLWFFANSILWPFNVEISGFHLRLNIIVLGLVGALLIVNRGSITRYSAKVLIWLAVFLLISYLEAIAGICTDQLQKLIITAPILLVLVLIASEVGWRATDADWLKLQKTSILILLFTFSGFVIEALLPENFPNQYFFRVENKLSGLFDEPSHVAYSLLPSLAILLVAEQKYFRIFGILALLVLLIFSRSSTLIALIFVWGLYQLFVMRKTHRRFALGFGLLLVVVFIAMQSYSTIMAPILLRIDGVIAVNNTTNTSSLVYVQGWQDAWVNLRRTNGVGLGFNMMGCTPLPDVPARAILARTYLAEFNKQDGSTIFTKLVSEAGVMGILFFTVIVGWWIRIERRCRKYNAGASIPVVSIQTALIFSFIATSVIRSPGYFNGGVLLLAVAVAATARWHKITQLEIKNSEQMADVRYGEIAKEVF